MHFPFHFPSSRVPREVALTLSVAMLCAALLGCAQSPRAHSPAAQEAVQPSQDADPWSLSPDAQADFAYLLAQDLLRQGNGREAQRALKLAINLAPTPRLFLELAEVQWRMGESSEARQTLKLGLDQFPSERDLLLPLVDAYMGAKRYDDAATTLELYLKDHPDDAELLQRLAQVQIGRKAYVEALQTLSRIPAAKADADTVVLRAQANAGLGLTDKAIGQLKSVIARDPANVAALAELAYLHELRKDYLNAEDAYGRILEMGETSPDVWIRLINANLKLNNPDRALSIAQQGPQTVPFILDAARLFIADGFHEQAGILLEPLASATPQPPEVAFFLALIAFEGEKDAEKAMQHLAHIGPDSPNYGRALLFRAQLLLSLKRNEEALAAAVEGRERFPEDRDFLDIQAWALQELDRQREAAELIETSLAKWPEDVDLLYRLGVLREELGESDRAIAAMERIISLDPTHAEALNFVAYLLAEQGRDLDRALILANSALKEKPESGFIVDTLAWVHFKRGELDRAWREIRRAVGLVEDDPTIWEHYGDIAAALGLKDKARKGYRTSLDLGGEHAERVRAKLRSL